MAAQVELTILEISLTNILQILAVIILAVIFLPIVLKMFSFMLALPFYIGIIALVIFVLRKK